MKLVAIGVAISVLMVFDIALTEYGVSIGIPELNPLARSLIDSGLHIPFKLSLALAILLGLIRIQNKLNNYLSNPRTQELISYLYRCGVFTAILYSITLVNNVIGVYLWLAGQ